MHVLYCLLYQTQTVAEPGILNRIVLYAGLLVCMLAVAFLIFFIISRNKQNNYVKEKERLREGFNQQLILAQTEIQEITLSSLGKELHDNIGQLLGTVKMMIGVAKRNIEQPNEALNTADETLSLAVHELRSLSKTLNKEWLEQFSFIDNLHTEMNRINHSPAHRITLNTSLTQLPLNADKQLIVFRIVQEAINNACRHAKATKINITAEQTDDAVCIRIADNGTGFSASQTSQGVGLLNMKHRAEILNGTLQVQSAHTGTTISLLLPQSSYD
jgi:signal transduction histidine kinase